MPQALAPVLQVYYVQHCEHTECQSVFCSHTGERPSVVSVASVTLLTSAGFSPGTSEPPLFLRLMMWTSWGREVVPRLAQPDSAVKLFSWACTGCPDPTGSSSHGLRDRGPAAREGTTRDISCRKDSKLFISDGKGMGRGKHHRNKLWGAFADENIAWETIEMQKLSQL